jgi:hypothetical protein
MHICCALVGTIKDYNMILVFLSWYQTGRQNNVLEAELLQILQNLKCSQSLDE